MIAPAPYEQLREAFDWDLPARLNMGRQVLDHPDDAVAIRDLAAGRDLRFGELRGMAGALAALLRQRGVVAGDRVGVLLGQDPWCAAAHAAIWALGAISVPLFKLFQHDALATRLTDSGARVVVTDADGARMLAAFDLAALVPADMALDPVAPEFAPTGPEDPAILIYTSGTTGAPKGALHGHRLLTGHLPGVEMSHDFLGQKGDVIWTPADWAWIGGLFDVLMPGLALGVPVVAARMPKFAVAPCLDICARGGVRNVFAEDCQMSSPDLWYMLRIKTNSLRGGFVENVHVRNVKIGTVGIAAIRVNFHYSDGDIGEHVPSVKNVSVSDVSGEDVRQVLFLQGYERSPVQNVRVSNSRFEGVETADVVEHVEGLVLDNVYSDFDS